jgi:hypothetical protein
MSVHADTHASLVGKLSMAMALAVKHPHEREHLLRSQLDDLLAHPVPSAELKQMIREEMRGAVR